MFYLPVQLCHGGQVSGDTAEAEQFEYFEMGHEQAVSTNDAQDHFPQAEDVGSLVMTSSAN